MARYESPISILQELTQKKGKTLPQYTLGYVQAGASGSRSNSNNFHMKVDAFDITASGFGSSKKEAKQNAATEILKKLAEKGLYGASPDVKVSSYVNDLIMLCLKHKIPLPVFKEPVQEGSEFTCKCEIASNVYQGVGKSEEEAKESVARIIFNKINRTEEDTDHDTNDEAQALPIKRPTKENERQFIQELKAKMKEKNITFADCWEARGRRNEEHLNRMLGLLGVEYKIVMCEKKLIPVACILFNGSPFSLMAHGSNEQNAKLNLIGNVFTFLDSRLN